MQLIAHWRLWWRRASTWLAALNGLFVAYVFSQPILVIGLIGFAPGEYALPLAAVAGIAAFGLPVVVAQISQPKLAAKRDFPLTAPTDIADV